MNPIQTAVLNKKEKLIVLLTIADILFVFTYLVLSIFQQQLFRYMTLSVLLSAIILYGLLLVLSLLFTHIETIDGYVSSSLFDIKNSFTTPKLKGKVNLINDNLGEFHQNENWSLEILVNQKPQHDVINKIINSLAQELKIEKYLIQDR